VFVRKVTGDVSCARMAEFERRTLRDLEKTPHEDLRRWACFNPVPVRMFFVDARAEAKKKRLAAAEKKRRQARARKQKQRAKERRKRKKKKKR